MLAGLTLSSFFVGAQNCHIVNGDTLQVGEGKWNTVRVFGQDSSGFYVYSSGGEFAIRKFSLDSAKLIFKAEPRNSKSFFEHPHELINYTHYMVDVGLRNGRIVVFLTVYEKSRCLLLLVQFNATTGQEIGDPKVCDEIDAAACSEWGHEIFFSPDNSNLLVGREKKVNGKPQEAIAKLYDAKSQVKLWEKDLIQTYKNSTVSSYNYLVTNDGNLYFLFDYLTKAKSAADYVHGTEPERSQGLAMIGLRSEDAKVYDLPKKGIITRSVALKQIDNRILYYGKFHEDSTREVGVFFVCVDGSSRKVLTESFDKTYGWTGYWYANSKVMSVFMLNGCYYFVRQNSAYLSKSVQYWDITVCKYDSQNKFHWISCVPMNCVTSGPELLAGVTLSLKNDNIKLYYRDHKKNISNFNSTNKINPKDDKALQYLKDAVLVQATINEKGRVTRKAFPGTQKNVIVGEEYQRDLRELSIESKNNSIIVLNYLNKKNLRSYSIVTFND